MKRISHWIGGRSVAGESGRSGPVYNPATGRAPGPGAFPTAQLVQNRTSVMLAMVLGALFTVLQAYEYSSATFGFAGNIYGASFFMATGFHGAHVIIGTIFLGVCLIRALRGDFTPTEHVGFEAAAWYWHFVDVVWLFLFTCIYWWGQ